jgi:UDPglucose 6-dehydrogenase
MRVAMIGTGYVGLVSGACLSEFGHEVICVDKDQSKVKALEAGQIPIFEPGLDEVVAANVKAGRLSFTSDLKKAVPSADAVFIAVGTPSRRGDGHADLTYVFEAAEEIAQSLDGYTVVVTKSTVPVGTGRKVEDIIRKKRPDVDFDVASNPEFLREGSAIEDFRRPDRVVVGCESDRAKKVMREIYRPLYLNETPILFTSRESSELIKYAANAFLATKITFINEMADLCERLGADVQDVARGIGLDGRIGGKFLHAGPGFGGSCFPKDTRALASVARQYESSSHIVDAVIEVNQRQGQQMLLKIRKLVGNLKGKSIAVLGLAFKPETDDMRDAPAIGIIKSLLDGGANVRAYDPVAKSEAMKVLPDIVYADDEYAAVTGADALVFVTEWNQFRALDMNRIRDLMKSPKIADLRNIYKPEDMREMGFEYVGVGR